jgi:hypothetical protein
VDWLAALASGLGDPLVGAYFSDQGGRSDKSRWHYSAVWIGTVCRKNGIFGPLCDSITLLDLSGG